MLTLLNKFQNIIDTFKYTDFIAPIALRLYLAPIFFMAGANKLNNAGLECLQGQTACDFKPNESIIEWFRTDLELPSPELLAYLAAYTEYFGAFLLLIGLAVRWIAIPLMFTMVIAIVKVHMVNGWLAIADAQSFLFVNDRIANSSDRIEAAQSILKTHGNYDWLTGSGRFVILNDGMEFAVTYLIMLLVLFYIGAGKYFSFDHWIDKIFRRKS